MLTFVAIPFYQINLLLYTLFIFKMEIKLLQATGMQGNQMMINEMAEMKTV